MTDAPVASVNTVVAGAFVVLALALATIAVDQAKMSEQLRAVRSELEDIRKNGSQVLDRRVSILESKVK